MLTDNFLSFQNIFLLCFCYLSSCYDLCLPHLEQLAHTTLTFVFTFHISALTFLKAKGGAALFFFNNNYSNCIIILGVVLIGVSVFLLFSVFCNGSNSTNVKTSNIKSNYLKFYLAATGVSISNLNPGLYNIPGVKGSIDPSSFYSLANYKSCEDLLRMKANADYFKGYWNSILRYKLDKV